MIILVLSHRTGDSGQKALEQLLDAAFAWQSHRAERPVEALNPADFVFCRSRQAVFPGCNLSFLSLPAIACLLLKSVCEIYGEWLATVSRVH